MSLKNELAALLDRADEVTGGPERRALLQELRDVETILAASVLSDEERRARRRFLEADGAGAARH